MGGSFENTMRSFSGSKCSLGSFENTKCSLGTFESTMQSTSGAKCSNGSFENTFQSIPDSKCSSGSCESMKQTTIRPNSSSEPFENTLQNTPTEADASSPSDLSALKPVATSEKDIADDDALEEGKAHDKETRTASLQSASTAAPESRASSLQTVLTDASDDDGTSDGEALSENDATSADDVTSEDAYDSRVSSPAASSDAGHGAFEGERTRNVRFQSISSPKRGGTIVPRPGSAFNVKKTTQAGNRFISLSEMDDMWRDESIIRGRAGVMDQSWFDWGNKNWDDPGTQAEQMFEAETTKQHFQGTSTRSSSTLGEDSQENTFRRTDSMDSHHKLGWNPRDAESSWTAAWKRGHSPYLPAISRPSSRRSFSPTSPTSLSMEIDHKRSKRDEALEQIAQRRPAGQMTPATPPTRIRRQSSPAQTRPLTPSDLDQVDSSALREQLYNLRPAGVPSGHRTEARERPARMRNPSGTLPPVMPWR